MELSKLSRKSGKEGFDKPLLREVAYDRLKEAIQIGELQPGEPLYEIRLSEVLQISRTPIREALQQLVLEGLVKNMPNRAMTVAELSMQDLLNVMHIRLLIEPEVARLVAESASEEMIAVLWQAVIDLEAAAESGNRKEWSRADNVYHETLCTACPNTLLGELGLQMRNRTHLVATDVQTSAERLKACTYEHRTIAQAIENRDGEAAQKAMSKHIQYMRESFFKRMMHS